MKAKAEYIPKINVAFFCVWGESSQLHASATLPAVIEVVGGG
jgi:hypothetical protein